jgi:hypothetical protein
MRTRPKTVVFLGHGEDKDFVPFGTAFLIYYDNYQYLVTAKHIANFLTDAPYSVKLNKAEGGATYLHVDGDITWFTHDDETVDIALAPFHWDFRAIGCDVKWIPLTDESNAQDIKAGDTTYTVGLFRFMGGTHRSLPVVHTGSIALIPNSERIPVQDWDIPGDTNKRKMVEGYLVESTGLQGLSGSPVFTRLPIELELPIGDGKSTWTILSMRDLAFLGVWQAAWDAQPDVIHGINGGARVTVPIGMGVVVPRAKIIEILISSNVTKHRVEQLEAIGAKSTQAFESDNK